MNKKREEYLRNREGYLRRAKKRRVEKREEIRTYLKEYYNTNKEVLLQYQKEYAVTNYTKLKLRRATYYQLNKERILARSKKNYNLKKNLRSFKDIRVKTEQKRRAVKRGVSKFGNFTKKEWGELKAKHGFKCLGCGKSEPTIVLTVDHITPLSRGGLNIIKNIQPLCVSCNSSKGNRVTVVVG